MTISNGTEFTTGLTDLINGIVALIPIFYLLRKRPLSRRNRLWITTLSLFVIVSFLGAMIHMFEYSEGIKMWMRALIYPFICLMLSYFVLSVRYDADKGNNFDLFYKIHIGVTLVLSVVLVIFNYFYTFVTFRIFSVFCLVNMIYIIIILIKAARKDRRFLWYFLAVFIFIIGNILQLNRGIYFKFGDLEFNNNGAYHFTTLIFTLLMFKGIKELDQSENHQE
ncbi:MAG: hypothetical protein IJH00_03675 [Erysipelotrichaceae bacterium]|nr:hypothetical protein [Erysipelotrichaceae bacterium]MBQ4595656.1 hypothetical protein [Bacillota bacterium]